MQKSGAFVVGAAAAGAILAAGLLASAAPLTPHGRGSGATTAPSGPAEEVLRQARPYRSWRRLPKLEAPRPSKAHTGNWVVAWYDDAAAPAVTGGAATFPDGSIIVKENRLSPDGDPASLSIMAKRGGKWFWISASPDWKVFTASDGKPLAGDVGSCAGCHGEAPKDAVYSL